MSHPVPPRRPANPAGGEPPVDTSTHSAAHEERILAAAFGDDAAGDPMALAESLADCDGCVAAAMRALDELLALHALAGRPRDRATAPDAITRLDALLSDAMVLRGERAATDPTPPAGEVGSGEKAEDQRDPVTIPLGPGRR